MEAAHSPFVEISDEWFEFKDDFDICLEIWCYGLLNTFGGFMGWHGGGAGGGCCRI